jgi:phage-related protein
MPANYVEIKVKARDDAQPDMTALRARLDELGGKVETAKVGVDDLDAKATLADLSAKLAAMSAKAASPKVTLAGAARMDAQLAAADAKLSHVGGKTETVTIKARADGLKGTVAGITGLDAAMAGAQSGGGKMKLMLAGLNLATGLLEPVMAGAVVAVGGLASGLAAAGTGIGIFGLVAKSAYSQVSGAVQAYGTALSTTGKASAAAMAQYKAQMGALTPPQRAFAVAIDSVQQAWQGFVAANTSGVTKILNQGMGLLPSILARMQPFLAPVESALHGIIGDLGKDINSAGFKSFMQTMAANTGPMITDIAHAIGHVVVGIGGILKAFMPVSHDLMHGLDDITAKFAHWGQTLGSHSGFQSLMSMFKSETPIAVNVLKNLGGIIKTVVADMTGLSTFSNSKMLLQLALPITQMLNAMLKANPDLVRFGLYLLAAGQIGMKFKSMLEGLKIVQIAGAAATALMSSALQAQGIAAEETGAKIGEMTIVEKLQAMWDGVVGIATKAWAAAQFLLDSALDANPIGLIVIAIAALVLAFVELWKHSAAFRDFWKTVWKDIKTAFDDAFNFIKDHWKLILAILTGPIGLAVLFISEHWRQIVAGARSMISSLIGFFSRLPGDILHAVGSLGRLLWGAGQAVLQGLLGGIESMVGDVIHEAENVGSSILHGIEGALGISSPSRKTFAHGQMLALGLINGMDSMRGQLAAAGGRMGRSAMPGGGAYGHGAGAGGQRVIIEFHPGSIPGELEQALWRWLRNGVRVKGGGGPDSVQRAFGRTT